MDILGASAKAVTKVEQDTKLFWVLASAILLLAAVARTFVLAFFFDEWRWQDGVIHDNWNLLTINWIDHGVFGFSPENPTLSRSPLFPLITAPLYFLFGENYLFWAQADAGSDPNVTSRDVFFIQTRKANGNVMVYRNEDTGWGWPPYFKFDTADLQAQARVYVADGGEPKWVALRHYGWRSRLFSIFPNAVSLKPVDGPDERLIPWFNIVFLSLFALAILSIWRLWRNFRSNRIDPLVEDLDARGDRARGRISQFFSRK